MTLKALPIALAAAITLAGPAAAQSADTMRDEVGTWVTLGTSGGPVTNPGRSQPANLLRFAGKDYLVDVGDGAAGQISKVDVQSKMIDGIFISHLHFDHTGGLAAILGLRFQTSGSDPLTIYGPPGTREMVEGLLASMVPGATANYGVAGAPPADHRAGIEVVELRGGDSIAVDGMRVQVASNTHYSFPPQSDLAQRFQSLSYRFDLPGRSIVYTGDTGPSDAVETLAMDADLLVAEMMDIPLTIERMRMANPGMPQPILRSMQTHLSDHHLSASDVGELASRSRVGAVAVTHFSGWAPTDARHAEYLRQIAEVYDGPIVIADDMDAL
ncbi:MBL fold metallo-hydrolase [Citromicrobium bathyomarinum]|uniref:MBL fold metallo-hydrolase n=1 Tax=Citromicrobium bathyomarinum TaxID=72174 RepID=UPI00315A0A07